LSKDNDYDKYQESSKLKEEATLDGSTMELTFTVPYRVASNGFINASYFSRKLGNLKVTPKESEERFKNIQIRLEYPKNSDRN
jgi:hypothetical protein